MVVFTVQRQEPRVRSLLKGNGSVGESTDHTSGTSNAGDGGGVGYGDNRRAKPCCWFPSHPHGGEDPLLTGTIKKRLFLSLVPFTSVSCISSF